MKLNVDWEIINNHRQRWKDSCVSSAVEMVLKLLNKVDVDYYTQQEKW